MTIKIHQWQDIEDKFVEGSLLLGNGASMAVSANFSYSSLFKKAKELGYLTPPVQQVFDKFDVSDFELVLRRLWQAKLVNEALGIERGQVEAAYEQVREALISTVREVHVTYEDAEPHLEHIYIFMQQFKSVVSLNYDLIVYWAAQYGNRKLRNWFKDCFYRGYFAWNWQEYFKPYISDGATLYFYPHGNLVLHREDFSGSKKIQARDNENLLEAILRKWEYEDLVPVFVCEGTRKSKENSISSCDYLERVFYEVLPDMELDLVIYGWGFGEQDEHLLAQIQKSNATRVAVSIYDGNQTIAGHAEKKLNNIGITDIYFFDSKSPGSWNNPLEIKDKPIKEATLLPGEKISRIVLLKGNV